MKEKDETGMRDPTGTEETAPTADSRAAEGRRGPTWRGWVLSILVAVILSVTATMLLGGSGVFRSDRVVAAGAGAGRGCCLPADAGK